MTAATTRMGTERGSHALSKEKMFLEDSRRIVVGFLRKSSCENKVMEFSKSEVRCDLKEMWVRRGMKSQ
jgi:hypothetical protein